MKEKKDKERVKKEGRKEERREGRRERRKEGRKKGRREKKMWCIYIMEYYSSIMKNEIYREMDGTRN